MRCVTGASAGRRCPNECDSGFNYCVSCARFLGGYLIQLPPDHPERDVMKTERKKRPRIRQTGEQMTAMLSRKQLLKYKPAKPLKAGSRYYAVPAAFVFEGLQALTMEGFGKQTHSEVIYATPTTVTGYFRMASGPGTYLIAGTKLAYDRHTPPAVYFGAEHWLNGVPHTLFCYHKWELPPIKPETDVRTELLDRVAQFDQKKVSEMMDKLSRHVCTNEQATLILCGAAQADETKHASVTFMPWAHVGKVDRLFRTGELKPLVTGHSLNLLHLLGCYCQVVEGDPAHRRLDRIWRFSQWLVHFAGLHSSR